VIPIDSFTGQIVEAALGVTVEGLLAQPVHNRSGMYVFLDLPPGPYNVKIKAEKAGYFDPEIDPFQPGGTASDKRLLIPMMRRPGTLSTGSDATIAAGMLTLGGQPADDAIVEAAVPQDSLVPTPQPPPFATRTDSRGAFALRLRLPEPAVAGDPDIEVTFTFKKGIRERELTRGVRHGAFHSFSEPIALDGPIDLSDPTRYRLIRTGT
jgi:hypothetical protein